MEVVISPIGKASSSEYLPGSANTRIMRFEISHGSVYANCARRVGIADRGGSCEYAQNHAKGKGGFSSVRPESRRFGSVRPT